MSVRCCETIRVQPHSKSEAALWPQADVFCSAVALVVCRTILFGPLRLAVCPQALAQKETPHP